MRGCIMLVMGVVAISGFGVRPAAAQKFKDVEYLAGHAGMDQKTKGTLQIDSTEFRFAGKDGHGTIVVPFTWIRNVGTQSDVRDASFGKKLMFGVFAGHRKDELVQVTYESGEVAEGLVFRVKEGMGTGIVAKLEYGMRRTQEQSAPSDSGSATATVAP